MSARVYALPLPTVEQYLARELTARRKSEYVRGRPYLMAGARNRHNEIATNVTVALGVALRGKRCRPYNSDTKVRVRLGGDTRFYYPDALVVCDRNPPDDTFQDRPTIIVEVTSPSTRRIDEGEKRDAYLSIPSLQTYLLIDSTRRDVLLYQRGADGFDCLGLDPGDTHIPLPSLGIALALDDIYDGVSLPTLSVVPGEDDEPELDEEGE